MSNVQDPAAAIPAGGSAVVQTGSMQKYTKGNLLLINDKPLNYAMSNIFEIGATWKKSYDRVVIGKNGPYVLACFRAEGEDSNWWYMPHDDYVVLVEGEVALQDLPPRTVHVRAERVLLRHPLSWRRVPHARRRVPAGRAAGHRLELLLRHGEVRPGVRVLQFLRQRRRPVPGEVQRRLAEERQGVQRDVPERADRRDLQGDPGGLGASRLQSVGGAAGDGQSVREEARRAPSRNLPEADRDEDDDQGAADGCDPSGERDVQGAHWQGRRDED